MSLPPLLDPVYEPRYRPVNATIVQRVMDDYGDGHTPASHVD